MINENIAIDTAISRIMAMTAKKGAPGLSRMRRLLSLLDNPEKDIKIVHVAGTNGKGSICRFIYSILREAGISTGIFTSPHVMRYNERIETDGEAISDADFVRISDVVVSYGDCLNEEGYGYPSHFEILTAMAYVYFRERAVKYAVMEVGLGGELDPTNTVERPMVSVISRIGMDHMNVLGNSLEKICEAKADIIKPGVPIISSSPEEEIKNIIRQRAAEKGAEFIDVSESETHVKKINDFVIFDATVTGISYNDIKISLLGEHQVYNSVAAIAAVQAINAQNSELTGIDRISAESILKGLKKATNIGRFEVLCKKPYLIIDGSHNPLGIKAAVNTLNEYLKQAEHVRNICVVMGCFEDKGYEEMVDIISSRDAFEELKERSITYVATQPVSQRALPAEEVGDLLVSRGCSCRVEENVIDAYEYARNLCCDLTIALGSIYLIGDFRILYQEKGW